MDRLKAGNWDKSSRYLSLGKVIRTITALGMTVALAASATTSLNRVSCGKSSFNAAGTDACSVYLTAKANTRTYVTLSSNNPAVSVPGSVTVRTGALTTGFSATVGAVTTSQTALITAQAGGVARTFSITLSPAVIGTVALQFSSTSIGFGSVAVNTAVQQPLTLTSTGTAAVTVTSANISGTGFTVTGLTLPLTLNPGQTWTVELGFDPSAAGNFIGQFTLVSNASAPVVTLSGMGAAPWVDLSWVAPSSPSDPVVGYNIYRARAGTLSFQRINATPETQTTYADNSVQIGTTYDYIVKSLDAAGAESVPSNTTTITIP